MLIIVLVILKSKAIKVINQQLITLSFDLAILKPMVVKVINQQLINSSIDLTAISRAIKIKFTINLIIAVALNGFDNILD